MEGATLNRSRLIVGTLLILIAAIMFISGGSRFSIAGAIALGVLGLISIAIARK